MTGLTTMTCGPDNKFNFNDAYCAMIARECEELYEVARQFWANDVFFRAKILILFRLPATRQSGMTD